MYKYHIIVVFAQQARGLQAPCFVSYSHILDTPASCNHWTMLGAQELPPHDQLMFPYHRYEYLSCLEQPHPQVTHELHNNNPVVRSSQ